MQRKRSVTFARKKGISKVVVNRKSTLSLQKSKLNIKNHPKDYSEKGRIKKSRERFPKKSVPKSEKFEYSTNSKQGKTQKVDSKTNINKSKTVTQTFSNVNKQSNNSIMIDNMSREVHNSLPYGNCLFRTISFLIAGDEAF